MKVEVIVPMKDMGSYNQRNETRVQAKNYRSGEEGGVESRWTTRPAKKSDSSEVT